MLSTVNLSVVNRVFNHEEHEGFTKGTKYLAFNYFKPFYYFASPPYRSELFLGMMLEWISNGKVKI
jgi:hypothetical protein